MRQALIVGALVALVGSLTWTAPVSAQGGDTNLGTVTLAKAVTAGGQRLAPGAYQVRLTSDTPPPAVGQTPGLERFVEFVRGGKVVAREVATVVPEADIKQILDSPRRPAPNSSRVETLKGDDYVRVWINRSGNNYIIHLPAAA